ncbi:MULTISPECIES: fimbrial protein [Providencia]|uniref:Fimbrial protein n=1 Tax=Providencia rettgeri TaxID=587 RepID=A0AAJ6G0G0_PRORE|nr:MULTISPECIES: fimbrial protein [Providencia]WHT81751.1 fimbrial protein [Providencia rettgeri]WHT95914.1 fimbrial protein [Providencia rettgeri]WJM88279.1 fimbrial protein [Providencia rettgeri]
MSLNGIRLKLLTGALGITLLSNSYADTANLNLKLTIIAPPQCTIGGGDNISVPFGQVQQELIDGASYKLVPINYNLSCTSVAKNTLTMSLSWTPVTFNGVSAIQTNRSNLGIAVYRDTTRLDNGASINFDLMGTHPALYAVPVKPIGVMLSDAGEFSGAMTMTLNYQ